MIEPETQVAEGPSESSRATRPTDRRTICFASRRCCGRKDAILVSVAGGNSSEHLNLGRGSARAEMVEKLKQRFPSVTAVHYPASGTHFHAYVPSTRRDRRRARQIMLGLLGWTLI